MSLHPIADADARRVGDFLQAHMHGRIRADDWVRSINVPWRVNTPNHGFMLLTDNAVVGVYLAFYSERTIDGQVERFCNLGAWCVLPAYRFHSIRLLNALLGQPGYHFTDLSPSGNTVPVNLRLKFRSLDTTTAVIPNLPWPSWPGRCVITSDPAMIERTLVGADLDVYRDHAGTLAARHIAIIDGQRSCYLVIRRDTRKRVPVFASILYASNTGLLRTHMRSLTRHLLLRHGALATLAEFRVTRHKPWFSLTLSKPRPKMFKSPRLGAEHIDYLYSELTCVAW